MEKLKSVFRYSLSIIVALSINFKIVEQIYLHVNYVTPSIHNNWVFHAFYDYTGCMDVSPSGLNILLTLFFGLVLGRFLKKYKFKKAIILLFIVLILAILPENIYQQITKPETSSHNEYETIDFSISKVNIIDSVFHHHAPINKEIFFSIDTIISLHLNRDQYPDYYIVTKEGETPLFTSYFYDGKTGKEFKVDPSIEKGPHSEYEMTSKKVKAYSTTQQDAIVTSSTISCLIGEQVDLWRFNPYTQQIESELTFNTTNGSCAGLSDSVFYSNLYNYSASPIDTVFVYPGKSIQKGKRLGIDNIQPTSNSPLYYYVFNTEIDEWVKNK